MMNESGNFGMQGAVAKGIVPAAGFSASAAVLPGRALLGGLLLLIRP